MAALDLAVLTWCFRPMRACILREYCKPSLLEQVHCVRDKRGSVYYWNTYNWQTDAATRVVDLREVIRHSSGETVTLACARDGLALCLAPTIQAHCQLSMS